jgi:hypothetical protein
MLTKDLIKLLQDKLERDKQHEHIMGESTIEIDCFAPVKDTHFFTYNGFSPNIEIDKTTDGLYDILSCFQKEFNNGTK